MPMDWIQFWILIATIVATLLIPLLTGLYWLLRRLDRLEDSTKQFAREVKIMRKQRKADRDQMIKIDRDNIAIKTALKIPTPGQIVVPSGPAPA